MFITIGERTNWGPRMRRYIPKNRFFRSLSFLFYSGSAGGFLWTLILMGLSIIIASIGCSLLRYTHNDFSEFIIVSCGIGVYVIAYSLTGISLKRFFFNKLPEKSTTIIALMLLVAGSLFPMIIGFMVEETDRYFTIHDIWYSGNPFFLFWFGRDSRAIFVQWSIVWALIALAISVPWFLCQFTNFKPLKAELTETGNE